MVMTNVTHVTVNIHPHPPPSPADRNVNDLREETSRPMSTNSVLIALFDPNIQ